MKHVNVFDFYQSEDDLNVYILVISLHQQKYQGHITRESFLSSYWKLDQLDEILEHKKPLKSLHDRDFHYFINGNICKLTVHLHYRKNLNTPVVSETFEFTLKRKEVMSYSKQVVGKRSIQESSSSDVVSEKTFDSKKMRGNTEATQVSASSQESEIFQKAQQLFEKYVNLAKENEESKYKLIVQENESLRDEIRNLRESIANISESFANISEKLQIHKERSKDAFHHQWAKITKNECALHDLQKEFRLAQSNTAQDLNEVEARIQRMEKASQLEIIFYYNNKEKYNPDEIIIHLGSRRARDFYDFLCHNYRTEKYMPLFEKYNNCAVYRLRDFQRYTFMLKPLEIFRFNKMDDIRDIIHSKYHTFTVMEKEEFAFILAMYELNCEFELQNCRLIGNVLMVRTDSDIKNEFHLLREIKSDSLTWNSKIGYFFRQ